MDGVATSQSRRQADRNHGVCLARVLFSFLVVCNHFFPHGWGERWILPLRPAAVPVFFVLAFYFTASRAPFEATFCKRRLARILLPFWFWGIAFAPFYAVGFLRSHAGAWAETFRKILLQLAFGHVYNSPLWFLFDLFVLTAGWFAFSRTELSKRLESAAALVLAAMALLFQASGCNESVFGGLEWHVRFPLGRLAECIPFAAVGIVLAHASVVDSLRRSRFLPLHLVWLAVLCWPWPRLHVAEGFGYGGFGTLLSGTALTLCFLVLPLDKLPRRILDGIVSLSRYSLGIFCIHVPLGRFFGKVLSRSGVQADPLFLCLSIWFLCWALCALLVRCAPKTKCMVC